jgi:hypothetical protein
MLTPIPPPFSSADATEAVREIAATGVYQVWGLWPFKLMVTTFPSGSKNYVFEFRPFMKFAITVGFFWKV